MQKLSRGGEYFMVSSIDARGLACPMPVVRTKAAIDAGATAIEVLVDNDAARENVLRFAGSIGASAEAIAEADGEFRIRIRRD